MTASSTSWVLLRGLTREHRHWADFPEKLQQSFPGTRVNTPDLPGNGIYSGLDSPIDIKEMTQFVREDIGEVLANGPVNILALSLGAMVAVDWMNRYPGECAAGILMNTSLKGVSPFYHRLRPVNYPRIIRAIFTKNIPAREQAIFEMTSNLYRDKDELLKKWVKFAKQNTVKPANALRQILAASRYRASVLKPDVPVLLLNSKNDRLVNAKSSYALAQYWHLPVEVHPDAGHDLALDDGDWVCAKIKDWLADN